MNSLDFSQNSAESFENLLFFRRDFHGFLPEFHKMSNILMDLMLQTSKIQNSLGIFRNFAETFCRNSTVSFMFSPHQETEFHISTPPRRLISHRTRRSCALSGTAPLAPYATLQKTFLKKIASRGGGVFLQPACLK